MFLLSIWRLSPVLLAEVVEDLAAFLMPHASGPNTSCLILPQIAETKDGEFETGIAGKAWNIAVSPRTA